MLNLFSSVTTVFRTARNLDKINIDNGAAKLHYRLTTTFLIVATILVCAQQYIGNAIDCVQDKTAPIPQNVLDTYCFYFGTFTLKEKNEDENHPLLNIGPIGSSGLKFISYYQWVPYYLFFLSITFYSSHFVWKFLEGGLLKSVLAGINVLAFSVTDTQIENIPNIEERGERVKQIAEFMWQRIQNKLNFGWSIHLILIEVYTFIHMIFVYWLTDYFLGGNSIFIFLEYKTIKNVFPTISKCTFHKYGPTGTIQNHDSLCVLALNHASSKIFYFFHFWFPILLVVAANALIWRFISFALYKTLIFNRIALRQSKVTKLGDDDRKIILNTISYWDWIFMCYLSGNSDEFVFQEIQVELARCIKIKYGPLQNNLRIDVNENNEKKL